MGIRKNRFQLASILLFLLISQFSGAQDSIPKKHNKPEKSFLREDRHWAIEIPMWIPGYAGELAYGDITLNGEDGVIPTPPEQPGQPEPPTEPGWRPGDNLSRIFGKDGNINFFFMNEISYQNKKLYAHFDAFTGSAGGSVDFLYNNETLVKAKASAYLLRLFAGYRLIKKLSASEKFRYDLYTCGGIRLHSYSFSSELLNQGKSIKVAPGWLEPNIVLRNEFTLKHWLFVLQGDVGGFKIDGKISYMINTYAFYRISNLLSIKTGWSQWNMNYDKMYSGEDLVLKMRFGGPVAAISFHF